MSVQEVDFTKKEMKNKRVEIIYRDAATETIEASYFGVLEGFEDYLTFWKEDEDDPFLLIKDNEIFSLEILKEKENDHS